MRREPDLAFSVWAEHQTYLEEPSQTKCMGRFRFFQEALDYASYVAGNGHRCVVQGLGGWTSEYRPGGRNGPDLTGYTGDAFSQLAESLAKIKAQCAATPV